MLKRLLLFVLIAQVAFCGRPAPAMAAGEDAVIRDLRAAAVAHSARGNIDDALGKFDSAIARAESAYGRDSLFVAEMYFDAGLIALRGDRYQKAESCLTRAVELNPHSPSARLRLAEFFKKRGQMREAKDQVRKVLQRHPDCLEARQLLALTYQQEGNLAKATQECYVLSQAIHGKEAPAMAAEATAVAFAPPPPVVLPPVTPPVVSATANIRPSAKPVVKPEPKPEVAKPVTKKPEPAKTKTKFEKKKSESKKPSKQQGKKPPSVVAETGPQSSWGIPARLKSKAVLLTPVRGNKRAASAESDGGGNAKPDPKPEPKVEPKAEPTEVKPKPQTKPVVEDESSSDDEGFGGSSSAKPKVKPEAKPEVVKPKPVQVKPEMVKRPRAGLVPPPPPVIPTFMVPPPPGAVMQAPPSKPKLKPVEKPKEVVVPEKHSAGGGEDDSDFLLDWAGKKKGK